MSLETKIDALTQAVIALTTALNSNTNLVPSVAQTATVPAAPVAQAPTQPDMSIPVMTPAAAQMPVPNPVATPAPLGAAPVMPAPPTFMAPAGTVPYSASAVPFTDGKGLVEYVMNKYKALGPEKGSQIQGVLGSLGYSNINDVKPEHYATFYAGVEALG